MLTELRIQNFAIIDKLELRPGAGLIILTGETGAGKSIILDAVEMLVGGRAWTPPSCARIPTPPWWRVCSRSRAPRRQPCTRCSRAKT